MTNQPTMKRLTRQNRPAAFLLSLLALGTPLFAEVSSNASLNGAYYFRQAMFIAPNGATVTETRSGSGVLNFDGNGNFTITGQQLLGTNPPIALSGSGTYLVKPGGFVTMTNPVLTTATINARLGTGAVVGSSTESSGGVFDLFIAIPKSSASLSNATLTGTYWVSSLEFPNGGLANIRDTNFKVTANGAGAFAENSVVGEAHNLNDRLTTQIVAPMTYSVAGDATGTLGFPLAAGLTTTTQLIAGTKNIFVSQDGTYFIGGSLDAGGHGLVVGVKAFANTATNSNWKGFYSTAGLRFDGARNRLTGVVGGVNATSLGAVWGRRTRQSDGLFDASVLATFSLTGDGSGRFTSTPGSVDIASTGETFTTSGIDIADSATYELSFGTRLPPQTGPALFLDPQGGLNGATFAPPGSPVSPGGILTLFGTGFGTATIAAPTLPFGPLLGGIGVKVNGVSAPIFSVSPKQLSIIVPFGTSSGPATVVVSVAGALSNTIEVNVAATAPGIFTLTQNGLGDSAVRHANYVIVDANSPAVQGEVVLLFLSGMGATSPAVIDGMAAPGNEPFARVSSPVVVTLDGIPCSVLFSGLAPTLAGLYQMNIQLPPAVAPGIHSLAVQTVEGFTDMANLRVK